MEPVAGKTGLGGAAIPRQAAEHAKKSESSKFDRLRADLAARLATDAQSPAKSPVASENQEILLENNLGGMLDSGRSPQKIGNNMQQLQTHVAELSHQIAAAPNTSALALVRERLANIEQSFNASAKLVNNAGAMDDPKQLLQLQLQMYQLSENVEIMSRVVGDAASGVKTILQTQV